MEDCSQPEDEDCDHVSCSELVWAKQFGDTEVQIAEDMAIDADGNILLAGAFQSSINFGPSAGTSHVSASATDFYLAKLAPNGDYVWSKSFTGGGDGDFLARVAVSSTGQIFLSGIYKVDIDLGGGPLTATNNQDFFVASFDKDGNHVWSHTYGLNSPARVSDMTATPSGDVVIVGNAEGPIAFGGAQLANSGGKDAFVAKLKAADGSELWSHVYGDATGYPVADQEATAVASDPSGNLVVIGTTTGSIDLGLGFTDFTGVGLHDAFVVRLDAGGGPTWHTYFSGPEDILPAHVATDSMGSAFITGWFWGTCEFRGTDFGPTKTTTGPNDSDIFVVKLNAQGKHAWTKQLGDATAQVDTNVFGGFEFPLPIAVDSHDAVLVAGGFTGTIKPGTVDLTSAGDFDWFLAKFASDGAHLWSKSAGDAALAQTAGSLACDPTTDAIVVHGMNDGTLTLSASTMLTTTGSTDVVAAKFQP